MNWLIGSFIVASWLMFWFRTDLPIYFFTIFRWVGFKKNDPYFWKYYNEDTLKIDFSDLNRDELKYWMLQRLYPFFGKLFSCPWCFSFHISLYVAFSFLFLANIDAKTLILYWTSWPAAAIVIFNNTK